MGYLIYPELSFKIIGIIFKVYNELGYGYREKNYQKALEIAFKKEGLTYSKEAFVNIKYEGESVGKYFIDFIIDNKIILELKVGAIFHQNDIKQLLSYLESRRMKLGILALFSPSGVKYKRIVNNKIEVRDN
jgi:GxxExxY protein